MTPERQRLIQDCWRALEPTGAQLVERAAAHLLDIVPSSRSLFSGPPTLDACSRIADIIGQLVGALDEPKRFVPLAISLGRGNPDRGIDHRLYAPMGEALLWAIRQHLGDAFTAEIQTAWSEAHHLTAAIMQRAEQSRTGEFESFRTGEFIAYQRSMMKQSDP